LLIDRVIVTNEKVEIHYVIPTQPDGPHIPFCHLRTDYLNPHAFLVQSAGPQSRWLVSDQEPRFILSLFPMGHQLDPAPVLQFGPPHPAQIERLSFRHGDSSDGCPAHSRSVVVIGVIHAQAVMPVMLAEPTHQRYTSKSCVFHNPDLRVAGNQRRESAQQRHLGLRMHHAVLAPMNAPDQRQRPTAIGNGDDHQLVVEPQRRAVDQQGQPLTAQAGQQLPGDRLIVMPNVNPRVIQETAQPVGQTDHLALQRKLARNVRKVNTSRQKQTGHQPSQIAQPSDSFLGQPLVQLGQQCIMEAEAVLHNDSFSCGLGTNNYTRVADGLQMLLVFKVIGS
jgi:hypothetical protein